LDSFIITRIGVQLEMNYEGVEFGGVLTNDFMMSPPIGRYSDPMVIAKRMVGQLNEPQSTLTGTHDFITTGPTGPLRQLQFILNTDHRLGEGIHWVAICISMPDHKFDPPQTHPMVEYIDSFGDPPANGMVIGSVSRSITDGDGNFRSELGTWLRRVTDALSEKSKLPASLFINKVHYQDEDDYSNCGVYAVMYLRARAIGVMPDNFTEARITREQIERERRNQYLPVKVYNPTPFVKK
jgi:hypothetical protein